MAKITDIRSTEILDSRGNPTIKVELRLEDGTSGVSMVPSGASTGLHEAVELRDADRSRYNGKGVLKAIDNIERIIKPSIVGMDSVQQKEIDKKLIELDGTENKAKLGANSMLGVSMATLYAQANHAKVEPYFQIGGAEAHILPVPMMNVLNGGAHADTSVDFQEFMLVPWGFDTFKEALRAGAETYHVLKEKLLDKGLNTGLGDEGGYAPNFKNEEEALDLLIEAIESAGYKPYDQIALALDVAATEFYSDGKYNLVGSNRILSSEEFSDYLEELADKYPIVSIEDGMSEDDWDGWEYSSKRLNSKIQLVGDDLFVTNPKRLQTGIDRNIANSILIKVNQIGTVTETLEVIDLAKKAGYTNMISHRSGETEDTFIADLAFATNSGQIKTGAPARSDRVAKYNRLLSIEQELKGKVVFGGKESFKTNS